MMKRRLLVALVVTGALGMLAPIAARASVPPARSACVVVHGPNGATIQVGYAPSGPGDCHQL